jgi:hypothetical protein
MQSPETRATQRLLVQGFTLYPCAAAVSTRLVARSVLDDPGHAWAVLCDSRSLDWTAMLPEDDPLKAQLAEAAVRSADPAAPHVLCHTQGGLLLVPLGPDTLNARMRIEAAVALGKVPPAERLEAFPDELIELEAKRRAKKRDRPDETGAAAERAMNRSGQ